MTPLYDDFEKWTNDALKDGVPQDVVALNFNLYEDGDDRWSVDVVGTLSFDKDCDDWACDETTDFNTREPPFAWQESSDYETIATEIVAFVRKYLDSGRYADKLKALDGIGAGFVDGDLTIVYVK